MSQKPQMTPEEAIAARRIRRRLAFGFESLVALTLTLIVIGALVRAHGAGLACPDWPLCFGELIPRIDIKVGFEWTHRVIAGIVTLVFATLGTLAWRRRGGCANLSALLGLAVVLLATQIVLGALTVWFKLAPWTVTAHLITGNSFAATALLIALTLRRQANGKNAVSSVSNRSRFWIAATGGLLLMQIALGGLVSSRYAGMACPEWPTCNGGVWFPSWGGNVGLHLLHRLNGYALVVCLGFAAWISRRETRLRSSMALALALGIGQIAVGAANVLTGIPVVLTGLHTAFAGGLVLTLTHALRTAWSEGAPRAPIPAIG
jgi:cytochrome c oxidase assembly protein subunit 15